MSNTIKLKRSSTLGATPTAGSLEYGELALNYTDGNLFFKTAANVVTLLASTQIANYSGNVIAGNLNSNAAVTGVTGVFSGNVSANYFIGNGSQLTGIAVTSISNGNSNVAISSAGANVTMGITGTANTVVISPGSIFVNGLFVSPKTITSNVQMAADSSAIVVSPLTIGNGYTMSIPTSSTVYVWIPS
jgi:hypothetical protein